MTLSLHLSVRASCATHAFPFLGNLWRRLANLATSTPTRPQVYTDVDTWVPLFQARIHRSNTVAHSTERRATFADATQSSILEDTPILTTTDLLLRDGPAIDGKHPAAVHNPLDGGGTAVHLLTVDDRQPRLAAATEGRFTTVRLPTPCVITITNRPRVAQSGTGPLGAVHPT